VKRSRALACLLAGLVLLGGATACAEPRARSTTSTAAQATPAEFAALLEQPDTFALNVHTPDEGSIAGTDAEIPYDRLTDLADRLPADEGTSIAVYCRTGRMSTEAISTLGELGYRNVTELSGGMVAWEQAGRGLLPPP
jgi:phage shock protein E